MLRIFNEITYSASGGITQIFLLFIVDRHVLKFNLFKYYITATYITLFHINSSVTKCYFPNLHLLNFPSSWNKSGYRHFFSFILIKFWYLNQKGNKTLN